MSGSVTALVVAGTGVFLALFMGLELKTSRPDGLFLGVNPLLRLAFDPRPIRSRGVSYVESTVDAEQLTAFFEASHPDPAAELTHAIIGAVAVALAEVPEMNHFVVGGRKYARRGRWVSVTMSSEIGGVLSTLKQDIPADATLRNLVQRMRADLDRPPASERSWFVRTLASLPRPAVAGVALLCHGANHLNILPRRLIEDDPMFCSMFIVDLSKLGVEPGFHHLYNWGTCPVFLTVGGVRERPVRVGDELRFTKELCLRYTIDRRVDGGSSARRGIEIIKRVLEHPFEELR